MLLSNVIRVPISYPSMWQASSGSITHSLRSLALPCKKAVVTSAVNNFHPWVRLSTSTKIREMRSAVGLLVVSFPSRASESLKPCTMRRVFERGMPSGFSLHFSMNCAFMVRLSSVEAAGACSQTPLSIKNLELLNFGVMNWARSAVMRFFCESSFAGLSRIHI